MPRRIIGNVFWHVLVVGLIVLGIALAILAITAICYSLYYYVFSRWFSRKTTVQASVLLKKQNSDTMDFIDPLDIDSDIGLGTGSILTPLWEKFLDLIKYEQWRPQCLDDHYRVVFNVNGRKLELNVPTSTYIELIEGQYGVLTYKGNEFINYIGLTNPDRDSGSISMR